MTAPVGRKPTTWTPTMDTIIRTAGDMAPAGPIAAQLGLGIMTVRDRQRVLGIRIGNQGSHCAVNEHDKAEIVRLTAQGFSRAEITRALGLSEKTITKYRDQTRIDEARKELDMEPTAEQLGLLRKLRAQKTSFRAISVKMDVPFNLVVDWAKRHLAHVVKGPAAITRRGGAAEVDVAGMPIVTTTSTYPSPVKLITLPWPEFHAALGLEPPVWHLTGFRDECRTKPLERAA